MQDISEKAGRRGRKIHLMTQCLKYLLQNIFVFIKNIFIIVIFIICIFDSPADRAIGELCFVYCSLSQS